jgi:hypothetical protein
MVDFFFLSFLVPTNQPNINHRGSKGKKRNGSTSPRAQEKESDVAFVEIHGAWSVIIFISQQEPPPIYSRN